MPSNDTRKQIEALKAHSDEQLPLGKLLSHAEIDAIMVILDTAVAEAVKAKDEKFAYLVKYHGNTLQIDKGMGQADEDDQFNKGIQALKKALEAELSTRSEGGKDE